MMRFVLLLPVFIVYVIVSTIAEITEMAKA
jgi:hypothetical protein